MKTTSRNVCGAIQPSKLARNIGLILVGVMFAGCPASKPTSETAQQPAAGEKVVIRGSNTFGEELSPHLIAEYKKDHPAVVFDVQSKATVYGMAALLGGQCDIAGASREALKEELELARMRDIELNDYVVGSYSVAILVHAANPVGNLTKDQVRDIFTGSVTNWQAVGGPDAPIHLYIRDPISGTYLGFKELAMGNTAYRTEAKMFTDYAGIAKAVAQDANGIGYTSIDLVKNPGTRAVSIGGVEPSVPAVNKGEYPYSRVVRLYTNKSKESAAARSFVQFVLSERGQKIVTQIGWAPHP